MNTILIWIFVMIPLYQMESPGEVTVLVPMMCNTSNNCVHVYWLSEDACRIGRTKHLGAMEHIPMYALNCFHLLYNLSEDTNTQCCAFDVCMREHMDPRIVGCLTSLPAIHRVPRDLAWELSQAGPRVEGTGSGKRWSEAERSGAESSERSEGT